MRKPPAWLPQASDPGLAVAGGRRQCARGQDGAASLMEARATVYSDGGCPVCAREIRFYTRRPAAEALNWVDVTQADEAALGPGLSRGAALAYIHVWRAYGKLVVGAAAFAEIWRAMPGLRWLGLLLGVPPFAALAEYGYGIFLHARKRWR